MASILHATKGFFEVPKHRGEGGQYDEDNTQPCMHPPSLG